ncbi:MAG: DUF378 domain-containing protein [Patescibacteria group bacterium]
MKYAHAVSFILVIIGGLNWGLMAFGYNAVHMLVGGLGGVEQIVYILVGLSALYLVFTHKKDCKQCSAM